FVVAERPSGSVILTAAHVVGVRQGTTYREGKATVTVLMVEYVAVRGDNHCQLDVLHVGDEESTDIAVVGCTGGERLAPQATLTEDLPGTGEEVVAVGHPAGVPVPVVTVGYATQPLGDYLVASVAAASGSSGSPVYWKGRVY